MNKKFIEMAIEGMNSEEILKKFHQFSSHGIDVQGFIEFLKYLLPLYESKKKEALTQIIRATYTSIMDNIWEDPFDQYLYGHLSELKKLAKFLNIKIKKEDAV